MDFADLLTDSDSNNSSSSIKKFLTTGIEVLIDALYVVKSYLSVGMKPTSFVRFEISNY